MMTNSQLEERRKAAIPQGVACAFPIFAVRAANAEVWDVEGRRYIDFIGGMGTLAVGHSHPRVVAAVKAQLERFTHTFFGSLPYDGYVSVAERLNAIAPFSAEAKTLLVTTGAEAVENAVKIARVYTRRRGVVVFSGAFHGRTLLTLAMTSQTTPYKKGFGPFPGDVYRLPYPYEYRGISVDESLRCLDEVIGAEIEAGEIAGIVIEPLQGEGGFLPAPFDFLKSLRSICSRHGIVLIADEVQSGFGRTGKNFAIEYSGVEPDLLAVGKSLGGGLPIAGVIGRAEIMDSVPTGGLGGTYAGNPLGCAAALAVLEVIEQEALRSRAQEIGARLVACFEALRTESNNTTIGDIRGLGAMIGIELVADAESRQPATALTSRLIEDAAINGLLLASSGRFQNVIRVLAPLTLSDDIMDEALGIFGASLQRARGMA
jgi:4-aminobutyrate aminotransferase / (S)-3-amino-2-methylpropionate transaminase / 5-aminovalerate transaminase